MISIIRIASWVTLMSMLSCVAASTGAGNKRSRLAGRVTDLFGFAIPGAEVRLIKDSGETPRKAVTDAAGFYSFKRIPLDFYRLEASLAGFVTSIRELPLTSPGETRVDVGLWLVQLTDYPICRLTGRVSRAAGHELMVGATVTAVAVFDPDFRRTTLTDRNGSFTLVLENPAQYIIFAHSPGFGVRSGDFACHGGVDAALDFLLPPFNDSKGLCCARPSGSNAGNRRLRAGVRGWAHQKKPGELLIRNSRPTPPTTPPSPPRP